MDAICQSQVAQNDRTTTHCAMRTNSGASCNADTTRHRCVFPNVNVVTDLNEVVEFDAIFNDGILKCSAIDAGVGANFNVMTYFDGAQLFDFFPSTLVGCKTKTIGTDDNA